VLNAARESKVDCEATKSFILIINKSYGGAFIETSIIEALLSTGTDADCYQIFMIKSLLDCSGKSQTKW